MALHGSAPRVINRRWVTAAACRAVVAEVLPVWPERGALHRMEAETFGALLETLSQVHCPRHRVLTV